MPQLLGREIGPIGYGLMGLTWRKQPPSEEQAFEAMNAALDAGCNFWNGGEIYGPPHANSLQLLNKYFTKYPEKAERVVLSIKVRTHEIPMRVKGEGGLDSNFHPDGSPEGVKRTMENCLKLLDGKKSLDIYEFARVDKNVPIETTLNCLSEYVKAGKLGGIGLSEVSAATIEKAVATGVKIAGVEVELSLWSTDIIDNGVAKACRDHDLPIIAYSPIGRGFLTGDVKSPEDIPEDDMRKKMPRFQGENFKKNLQLVDQLSQIASQKGCTPAQLAIGWVKSMSDELGTLVVPIPGATTQSRVAENSKDITLTKADMDKIRSVLASFTTSGTRYDAGGMKHVEG